MYLPGAVAGLVVPVDDGVWFWGSVVPFCLCVVFFGRVACNWRIGACIKLPVMRCDVVLSCGVRLRRRCSMAKSKQLLAHINKTFGTLAFCRRWLERDDGGSFTVNGNSGKQERYIGALKNLCDVGVITVRPWLVLWWQRWYFAANHVARAAVSCVPVWVTRGAAVDRLCVVVAAVPAPVRRSWQLHRAVRAHHHPPADVQGGVVARRRLLGRVLPARSTIQSVYHVGSGSLHHGAAPTCAM